MPILLQFPPPDAYAGDSPFGMVSFRAVFVSLFAECYNDEVIAFRNGKERK